ncbi:WD repeat-containing protein 31-like [Xenia sp. Carnegie-2017]|uniref:WD repeat-containing protein 31-like n=1 Tax=Xenia sp. Carnegie-2017 TaxID=2897299 RepID=UPI001F043549|nr:WD repeat-containing protein 31-like [Xenia sp. Carnegie-2017]
MGPVKSKPKRVAAYKHNETSMFTNALETKEFSLVHDDRVSCVAAYKPGWCVSGSTDCTVGVFNFDDGKLCTRWKAHEKDITKVHCGCNHGQNTIFTSSRDKTIKSWLIDENNSPQLQCVYHGHELVTTTIHTNSDCSLLCSGSRDNSLRIWDVERAQCLKMSMITRNLITSLKWFPKDDLIAQTGEDKMLRIWDSRSVDVAYTFPPKQYFGTCCDVSTDGFYILTSSIGFNGSGCEVILWDVRGKRQLYSYLGHQQTVSSCCFLPRNTDITSLPLLVSVSHDSILRVWNQESQKCLVEENLVAGPLTDIALWNDGRFCISSYDCGIYQLNLSYDNKIGIKISCQTHF